MCKRTGVTLRSLAATIEGNATASSNSSNTTIDPGGGADSSEQLDWGPRPSAETFVHQIIIQKVIGLLSAMGSTYIVYKLVFDVKDAADRQKKLKRTFDRLLLGLCVSDIIWSMAIFFGSW